MKHRYLATALFLLGSCHSSPDSASQIERGGEPPIYSVTTDDAAMGAAIRASKATLPEFLRVFQRQDTATTGFAIKVHYDDGAEPEHIWLSDLSLQQGELHGVISNVPEFTKQVREGQRVAVDTSKVSDWKYVQRHRLVGGRTIRVLRNRLTPTERAELDASVDYRID